MAKASDLQSVLNWARACSHVVGSIVYASSVAL